MDFGKNRVAIYIRVSTLHQIDKDSLPMQRQDLTSYAKLILNTDNFVIFEDAGYSGKNTDRPQFQEMMSQIRNGRFTHLLVWKIDRISRNLLDFVTMYQELKRLGVTFVSKNEQFDTSSAMGDAMLKIILIFAELERQMASERVTATMISRASNGIWNGGRIPYGYDYDNETKIFSINQTEADIVQEMHDLYEQTSSLVVTSRTLNNRGYRTRAGGDWNPVSVRIILHNIWYCGDYLYNMFQGEKRERQKDKDEWVVFPDHHPPLISREQKQRIIATLDFNRRTPRTGTTYVSGKHTHIFAGLMVCGNCGSKMGASPAAHKKDWRYSKYSCYKKRRRDDGCSGKYTSDPVVGEFLFNYILNMLNAQKNFTAGSLQELQSQLLLGDTFKDIICIENDGLEDLYNVLASGSAKREVFYSDALASPKKSSNKTEMSKLRQEKQKLERALKRLTDLYLYSEDAMSNTEFITEKTKLVNALDDVNERIGITSTEEWNESLSDSDFIRKASEFILTQKLTDRKYVNYKRLAMSVDAAVLRSFVTCIVDSITMDAGRVSRIIFKNGLCHSFVYRDS